jgi:hypothetical protein
MRQERLKNLDQYLAEGRRIGGVGVDEKEVVEVEGPVVCLVEKA